MAKEVWLPRMAADKLSVALQLQSPKTRSAALRYFLLYETKKFPALGRGSGRAGFLVRTAIKAMRKRVPKEAWALGERHIKKALLDAVRKDTQIFSREV